MRYDDSVCKYLGVLDFFFFRVCVCARVQWIVRLMVRLRKVLSGDRRFPKSFELFLTSNLF